MNFYVDTGLFGIEGTGGGDVNMGSLDVNEGSGDVIVELGVGAIVELGVGAVKIGAVGI